MNIFVAGDIHGANEALLQCIHRSGFDVEKDMLICLGDVCDGWPEVCESIETLLTIKNLIYIMGNHDYWAYHWMKTGKANDIWLKQGGMATINSYKSDVPSSHIAFFEKAVFYHTRDNNIYVHGGFDPKEAIENQKHELLMWDRNLINTALNEAYNGQNKKITAYDNVFVGHTPTLNYNSITPIQACELWLMDTGAGWQGGVLTIMNVKTQKIYQSDLVNQLYKGNSGRIKY